MLKAYATYPCLWFQGLIYFREDQGHELLEVHEAKIWMTPRFDEVLAKSKSGYSDGTRGADMAPLNIRPAAFGATTFLYDIVNGEPHFHDFQILGGEVPGEQTVPRAETWAAIVLLTRVHANAVTRLGIDHSYVTDGVNNKRRLMTGKMGTYGGCFS